jgi:oligoendopeptidase F
MESRGEDIDDERRISVSNTLPTDIHEFMDWSWEQIQPVFEELQARPISAGNVVQWLDDRAVVGEMLSETYNRLYVAAGQDTTNTAAEDRLNTFLEKVFSPAQVADQALKEKLLTSGLQPEGYDLQMRQLRVDAEIFREENIPLFNEEEKLRQEFDRISGAQTVTWEGEERTLFAMNPVLLSPDRAVREQAWRLVQERKQQDRAALNDLWTRFLKLRLQIAENAGFGTDYRAYAWKAKHRFDYTPEDCARFADAIEKVVTPAAARIYERRARLMGAESFRPWDGDHAQYTLSVDPLGRPPLQPYQDGDELSRKSSEIFRRVDPALADYYDIMMEENLLDLDNRKGKAPGGYCTGFDYSSRPFIFMNSVGLHNDVQTLLHEAGHAFHAFETYQLPRYRRIEAPLEFCEVASMSMELIAAPYLTTEYGGFYDERQAARARLDHLDEMVLFWPYMAVIDSFQQWVYGNPDDAMNPDNCDAEWSKLWDRFMVGIDYSGLETIKSNGWHRKLHIFQVPLYYVEYGLAALGATQVWGNSLKDQAGAIANYRKGLALGGTATLPDLFKTAGANFAMDGATLGDAVALIERVSGELAPLAE